MLAQQYTKHRQEDALNYKIVREVNGALSVVSVTEVRWISVVPRVVFRENCRNLTYPPII
jgi:hypothetical protein